MTCRVVGAGPAQAPALRFAPSIDGSNTPNRTLVTYKETHYDAPVDPKDPPTWTGTWMDPRFSPPGDGGQPQNAPTGQLFTVNSGTTDITVPASYSKLRVLAQYPGGQPDVGAVGHAGSGGGTLGYEWDVDADNGFRPHGLMDLSETASGWQELDFSSPVTITAGTTYVASYHTNTGHYAYTANGLLSPVTNGPLTAVARAAHHPMPACADPRGYWSVLLMHVNAAAAYGSSASSVRAAMTGVPKIEHELIAEVRRMAQ